MSLSVTTPAEAGHSGSIAKKGGKPHSIILIDDEPNIIKSLERIFNMEGYRVLSANSAREALDILSTNVVEMAISDQNMPGMKGIEFLRILRDRYPNMMRIMLTGNDETEIVMGAVNDGAVYKFITKPWNENELVLSVRLAFSQYDLIRENNTLKRKSVRQKKELEKLRNFLGSEKSGLTQLLIDSGYITPGQFEIIDKYCRQENIILARAGVDLGMIDDTDLMNLIKQSYNNEIYTYDENTIPADMSDLIPYEICRAGCFAPVNIIDNTISLAMADPLDLDRLDNIKFKTGSGINPLLATVSDIDKALKYVFKIDSAATSISEADIEFGEKFDDIDILLDDNFAASAEQLIAQSATPSAIKLVNTIIAESVKCGASDIHIEPKMNCTLIRYRIDGLLQRPFKIPSGQHLSIISRIKVLAKMDIAERRIPQDGRITVKTNSKLMDLRISSLPTIYGEKIVCRILDKTASIWTIDKIGIKGEAFDRLNAIINIPQGMIIATGPTGSGKTTSLYAMMNDRLSPSLNFVTIEDPVEYLMENAAQVHVRDKIGLTFASTLRASLRQDPDVILVGEIRDLETAMAAFQASMTGHLVFSTLHTNSAIATISRLMHFGVQPFLIASAINGIFAQRLVRRVCPHCKTKMKYGRLTAKRLGLSQSQLPKYLFYGSGCENCNNTGYLGRIGIFEIFQMTEDFRERLTIDYRETDLFNMARSLGMKTLFEDGLEKVLDGETTLEEILRVLGPVSVFKHACKSCDSALDIKFSTCPYCGQQQWKICAHCNRRMEADWVACPDCGKMAN